MIWFTSDTHFGAKAMIERGGRPFSSVAEMDEAIIERWNVTVAKTDTVYHLGDFSFRGRMDSQIILDRLSGRKSLVVGNHDQVARRLSGWTAAVDYHYLRVADRRFILFHYPIVDWAKAHHGSVHLHGHMHGSLPGNRQRIDVGSDCWDFSPTSIDLIDIRRNSLPEREPVGHHQPPDHMPEGMRSL